MSSKRYTEEFIVEAVRQVTERGHPSKGVAKRLGVSPYSLYKWIKVYGRPAAEWAEAQGLSEKLTPARLWWLSVPCLLMATAAMG